MNRYKAFYMGKEIEVYAETSYAAQVSAAREFRARYTEAVSIVLFKENASADGYENQVRHDKQGISRYRGYV